jgi:hypothetical protein
VPDETASEYFTPMRFANSVSNVAAFMGSGVIGDERLLANRLASIDRQF